jgi:hypothetical protein
MQNRAKEAYSASLSACNGFLQWTQARNVLQSQAQASMEKK